MRIIEKLLPFALAAVLAAAATGRLPQFIQEVRVAQLKLLKVSRDWGKPVLLPVQKADGPRPHDKK